jgi:hypothetical protein
VTVLPVSGLQVKLLESPKFVIAGEEYQSSFVVTNQGNTKCTINTKVDSRESIPYVVDAEKFTLAPGQSKTVVIKVKTDVKMTERLKHYLQLTAEAFEDDKVKVKAKSASSVEIIPRTSGAEDNFHKIPAEVTLRYVSQDNEDHKSGFQTDVHGEGTLNEEGKKHIKFHFRGPDIIDKSIFGERDEYSVSYQTEEYEFHLGDRSYSLSSLTENYLYGRGLEGKLNVDDNLGLGAYHMRTRWLEPETQETGVYVDYLINDKYKVGLNYLRKNIDAEVSNIVSFESQFEPFKDTQVELEYALGPEGGKKDNAYLTRLYGRSDWLSYYLKLTHAGPEYRGYYNDLDYISGGVTIPISKRLRLNTSFRREKDNLDLDPGFYSAPLEKYYQAGLDYRLETNTTFSFDWLSRERQDRLDSPKFDYQDKTFRFGIGQDFDKLTVHTSAEFGKTRNRLESATSDSERYTASVYFKPTESQFYSGYFYYDKDSDFTGENRRSATIGVNARYKIANRTFFNLALQTNNYQGSAHGDRDNLELGLSHTFTNDNKISLLARHTRYRDSSLEDDTALMVQYTIPLGLAVCPKKSVGSVKGHIYDQESQNPIGDVILRLNGLAAVTNTAGDFTFPSVKPGSHYLNIDTASIGMDRIPSRKMPMELTVEGGEKTQVDIPVTQAARLSGGVVVYSYRSNKSKMTLKGKCADADANVPYYVVGTGSCNATDAELVEDYGLANTIVELKNSSEIRRTVTDNQGRFEFEELRPGKWILKIHGDNLPECYYFEKDTFEVELVRGQKGEIWAKVLPQKRHIRIITEPQIVLEEEQK